MPTRWRKPKGEAFARTSGATLFDTLPAEPPAPPRPQPVEDDAGESIDDDSQDYGSSDAIDICQECAGMDCDLVSCEGRQLCPRCVAELAEERCA